MATKDLSLDKDDNRTLGKDDKYPNCLGYCVNFKSAKEFGRTFPDACNSYQVNIDGDTDLVSILTKVNAKIRKLCKRKWVVIGSSHTIPNTHAPDISKRVLIGVGREAKDNITGDLHFYVVTQTNGDGQSISGTTDAKESKVLPCKLRKSKNANYEYELIQHVGNNPNCPVTYELIGFFTTNLSYSGESGVKEAEY